MSIAAHLTAINTSEARHLRALTNTGHLHALRCHALTGPYIIDPGDLNYAAFCYRAGYYAPAELIGITQGCMSGFNSLSGWQSGQKAVCTYWGRDSAPSIDPHYDSSAPTSPSCAQRSECVCCGTAMSFDLKNLPAAYSVTSAKLGMYKPSFMKTISPISELVIYSNAWSEAGWSGWPSHNLSVSFATSVGTPSQAYSASSQQWGMVDLCNSTLQTKGLSVSSNSSEAWQKSSVYNFWDHASMHNSSLQPMGSYYIGGFPMVLREFDADGTSVFAGTWIEKSLDAAVVAWLSNHRGKIWMRAAVAPTDMLSYKSTAYTAAQTLLTAYVGGFYLSLTLSGGGN